MHHGPLSCTHQPHVATCICQLCCTAAHISFLRLGTHALIQSDIQRTYGHGTLTWKSHSAGPQCDTFFRTCSDGEPVPSSQTGPDSTCVVYPVDPTNSRNTIFTCPGSSNLYCVDPGTPYHCPDGRDLDCAGGYDVGTIQDSAGTVISQGDPCFTNTSKARNMLSLGGAKDS